MPAAEEGAGEHAPGEEGRDGKARTDEEQADDEQEDAPADVEAAEATAKVPGRAEAPSGAANTSWTHQGSAPASAIRAAASAPSSTG